VGRIVNAFSAKTAAHGMTVKLGQIPNSLAMESELFGLECDGSFNVFQSTKLTLYLNFEKLNEILRQRRSAASKLPQLE